MANIKYREGDWFAVPLRNGGYATGVVARANPRAALLGYFFGPRRESVPRLDELEDAKASDAILIGKFGHLGLVQGTWRIIGRAQDWNRNAWPMPVFVRYEELSGRTFHVIYDDRDPAKMLREEPALDGAPGPKDGLMGAGFVERRLTVLLAGNADRAAGGN